MYFKALDKRTGKIHQVQGMDMIKKRVFIKEDWLIRYLPLSQVYVVRYSGMRDKDFNWIYDRDFIERDGVTYCVWYKNNTGQYVFSEKPYDHENYFDFVDNSPNEYIVVGSWLEKMSKQTNNYDSGYRTQRVRRSTFNQTSE